MTAAGILASTEVSAQTSKARQAQAKAEAKAKADDAALATTPSAELFAKAASWGYQLQDIDAGKLDRTGFDVLVVDAGSGDGAWGLQPADVRRLKTKPDGARRIVLAYLNIGEAEDYRYYWKSEWKTRPPAWMGAQNCRWRGDHRVKHWSREWQEIIFGRSGSYLDRLIGAGFDGVWLDRVDIYYYWRTTRWQAANDMVIFVEALSRWAKARKPGFLVVPQNGEELLSAPAYLAAIDGQGKEDLLFGDSGNDRANAPARVARALRNLAPAGTPTRPLPVLAVEYARRADNISAARDKLTELGYKAYFGPRSLAYIGFDGTPHKEDGDTEPTIADMGDESCG